MDNGVEVVEQQDLVLVVEVGFLGMLISKDTVNDWDPCFRVLGMEGSIDSRN
jgi:hypothetical protein